MASANKIQPDVNIINTNPFAENSKEVLKKPSLVLSVRFLLAVILAFCYIFNYMQRTNMSFAIVCMVNSTAVFEMELNETIISSNSSCSNEISDKIADGKFVWSKADQGLILSAYFYGYILTQIPGGWLALKYGARWVIGLSMLASSILTIIIAPIANLNSIVALFILRFFIGFFHGFVLPAISFLFVKWAPPKEKSRLMGIAGSATNLGSVISTLFGSYLCENGFYEGWGSIFILFGAFGIIWLFGFVLLTSETPANHKFIGTFEKTYIMEAIPESVIKNKKKLKTPWKSIFTSKSCWAIFIAHTFGNWGTYLFLTQTPTYMKDVLKFDIKSNGLYSSIPNLAAYFVTLVVSLIADQILKRNYLSLTNLRKLFNSIGMFTPIICVSLLGVIVDCQNPSLGVVLLSVGVGIMGCTVASGFTVNINDIGGQYAGILFGISNTFATLPGIIAPYLVGVLTPAGSAEEWRVVFIITAVVYFIGGLPFLIFAKGETEKWARVDDNQKAPI